jgi:hypothetical protein
MPVGYEIFMACELRLDFWIVVLHSFLMAYQNSGGICCLHIQS